MKLSSNENPFGPSPQAVEAIQEHAGEVHNYPKAAHTDLTAAIADRWDVEPRQVWLTPGGDGFLDYIGRAFLEDGDRVLVPDPGFAYYPMSARYHGASIDQFPLARDRDFRQTPEDILSGYDGQRLLYLTTPHNPTGSELTGEQIRTVAEATDEKTLVLVDEAYGEFSDQPSALGLLDDRKDVTILRTFSKAYGLAGMRLGYGLVPTAWADAYDRINTPFAVNTLACHAGIAALEDDEYVERTVGTVRSARKYIREHLGARTWESGGNFVLAEVGDGERVAAAAREEGVIVRDCSSFGLPDCIRITCGTQENTRSAVGTLNEVLEA